MAKFKYHEAKRGSTETEGYYFTSVRFPVELARAMDLHAQAHELSLAQYLNQSMYQVLEQDSVSTAAFKSELQISKGTTAAYNKKYQKVAKVKPEKKAKVEAPKAVKKAAKPEKVAKLEKKASVTKLKVKVTPPEEVADLEDPDIIADEEGAADEDTGT